MTASRTLLSLVTGLGLGLGLASLPACSGEADPAPVPAPATVVIAPRAPAAPAASPRRPMSEFIPSRDGFAFVNGFRGSPLPIDLGAAGKNLGVPDRFGLCGGMSTAAADYFLARKSVPLNTKPPARDTALYRYLYQRQNASLGPMRSMALKFFEWMRLPDADVQARTRDELPSAIRAVKSSQPAVLGLVLVRVGQKDGQAWENHQVLAFGLVERPGEVAFKVYDPNFPRRDDIEIRVRDGADGATCARVVPGRKDEPVRGLFLMPYEPATPE